MSFVTQMFNIHLHDQPLWPQALVSATPPRLPVNNVFKKSLRAPWGNRPEVFRVQKKAEVTAGLLPGSRV